MIIDEDDTDKHFKYEWEDDWEENDDVVLVGYVVVNTETCEAAIIDSSAGPVFSPAIHEADIRKDILGDAQRKYDAAMKALVNELDDRSQTLH
jgi:hypothetical protein